ncbi:MAG: hypothetical protein GY705_28615 [Bacteroidetes bacterium]|nr:hypothetical protein [Bacteroidota bacterium]
MATGCQDVQAAKVSPPSLKPKKQTSKDFKKAVKQDTIEEAISLDECDVTERKYHSDECDVTERKHHTDECDVTERKHHADVSDVTERKNDTVTEAKKASNPLFRQEKLRSDSTESEKQKKSATTISDVKIETISENIDQIMKDGAKSNKTERGSLKTEMQMQGFVPKEGKGLQEKKKSSSSKTFVSHKKETEIQSFARKDGEGIQEKKKSSSTKTVVPNKKETEMPGLVKKQSEGIQEKKKSSSSKTVAPHKKENEIPGFVQKDGGIIQEKKRSSSSKTAVPHRQTSHEPTPCTSQPEVKGKLDRRRATSDCLPSWRRSNDATTLEEYDAILARQVGHRCLSSYSIYFWGQILGPKYLHQVICSIQ